MLERSTPDTAPTLIDAVRRARQGSNDALAVLYTAHGAEVLGTAYRILGNRADAEDALQDVFVGLPEALAHYHEEGKLGAWLRRLAARTALMRLRRGRRESSFSEDFDPPVRDVPNAGPLERLAVADALHRLPEGLRQVFLLKEIEGFTHEEIGEMLGITPGASGVRLHRAWRSLRTLLVIREGR
jgi:RNA polymerase sigma-70 factor, ECF subfamily